MRGAQKPHMARGYPVGSEPSKRQPRETSWGKVNLDTNEAMTQPTLAGDGNPALRAQRKRAGNKLPGPSLLCLLSSYKD